MEPMLITAGDAVFYAEVQNTGGPQPIAEAGLPSFADVRPTIEGIASELAAVWDAVKPDEANVEFSLALTLKSGKLTALLVEGTGTATLKVSLTWKAKEPATED